MFVLEDFFKSKDIFNSLLRKRFEENFDPQSSGLWISPGHIVYTTSNGTKVHTIDARPCDLCISPSEAESDQILLTSTSQVLDVIFDSSVRMHIVFRNGDVQIFEYRAQLNEWARTGYFNVNIVSPNSSNNSLELSKVLVSSHQNMIYWQQGSDWMKREVPFSRVREITQSALGPPVKLIKNCPTLQALEVGENVCVIPDLPGRVHLYLILSARSHAWLFHIDGRLLWRGTVGDTPLDWISLFSKTLGLWTPSDKQLKLCQSWGSKFGHLLYGDTLVRIAASGEVHSETPLLMDPVDAEGSCEWFVLLGRVCCLGDKWLKSYSLEDGRLMQTLDLSSLSGPLVKWSSPTFPPQVGVFSPKGGLFHIAPRLDPEEGTANDNWSLFCLIRDVVEHGKVPAQVRMPSTLQSEALLLALRQSCREKGLPFPLKIDTTTPKPETKLERVLAPLVQSFLELESKRMI